MNLNFENEIEFNSLQEDSELKNNKRKIDLVYTHTLDKNTDDKYVLKRQRVDRRVVDDDICPNCGITNNIIKMYTAKSQYSEYDLVCGKCRNYVVKDGVTIVKSSYALRMKAIRDKNREFNERNYMIYAQYCENYASVSPIV